MACAESTKVRGFFRPEPKGVQMCCFHRRGQAEVFSVENTMKDGKKRERMCEIVKIRT